MSIFNSKNIKILVKFNENIVFDVGHVSKFDFKKMFLCFLHARVDDHNNNDERTLTLPVRARKYLNTF